MQHSTRCVICAICVTIHTLMLHKGVWFIECIICTHPALRSIYTQCVISHTLCNLCVLFYFYTNQVCFYTQCVVLHTFLLLGPINLDLRYFVAKSVFVIYAFFGVNFILRKFCLCKRNDKYEVWYQSEEWSIKVCTFVYCPASWLCTKDWIYDYDYKHYNILYIMIYNLHYNIQCIFMMTWVYIIHSRHHEILHPFHRSTAPSPSCWCNLLNATHPCHICPYLSFHICTYYICLAIYLI